ncbi:hypothetical protein TNCV_300251 [Trichonephila clavipes]|nr:hypothetical protein TNCV_300251 [Trichonephila clavipes]
MDRGLDRDCSRKREEIWRAETSRDQRKQMRELELERLRAILRQKLKEPEFNMNTGNKRNNLANIYYLSGNRTADVTEAVSKCRPLISSVVNKSVEDARSCDFENDNCEPQ